MIATVWPPTGQIRRGDPRRRHLHDFWLIDGVTGQELAGFATEHQALAYLAQHGMGPGQVTVLRIAHPDGCDCVEAPPVTSSGRPRRGRVG